MQEKEDEYDLSLIDFDQRSSNGSMRLFLGNISNDFPEFRLSYNQILDNIKMEIDNDHQKYLRIPQKSAMKKLKYPEMTRKTIDVLDSHLLEYPHLHEKICQRLGISWKPQNGESSKQRSWNQTHFLMIFELIKEVNLNLALTIFMRLIHYYDNYKERKTTILSRRHQEKKKRMKALQVQLKFFYFAHGLRLIALDLFPRRQQVQQLPLWDQLLQQANE